MNIGGVSRALGFGLLSVVTLACGGSDGDGTPDPSCRTTRAPTTVEIKDVSPAIGASLTNSGIVHTFTIVGRHVTFGLKFDLSAAHTAGQTVPSTVPWTLTFNGADSVYASEPIRWQNAPAHVEVVDSSGLHQDSECLMLPKQMFKYDITEP
jgi:hypothetical protein